MNIRTAQSFAAINPKILIMISNFASYNKRDFQSYHRYATYEVASLE